MKWELLPARACLLEDGPESTSQHHRPLEGDKVGEEANLFLGPTTSHSGWRLTYLNVLHIYRWGLFIGEGSISRTFLDKKKPHG